MTVTVPKGEQWIKANAVDYLRKNGAVINGGNRAGSLRITVSGGLDKVFAGARTAASSARGGEYGVFYPAVASNQMFSESAVVLGLKADASNRTNVAVLHGGEPGSGSITLELQTMDGSTGLTVGSPLTVTLQEGGWVQPDTFFHVENGYVVITRKAGTAPWYAYGVINDGGSLGQRTGDGSFISGLPGLSSTAKASSRVRR